MRLIKQLLALAALVPGLAFAQAPIKVGIANDLSGPFAALGAEARDGFNLAIKELGGKLGGKPAEFLQTDMGSLISLITLARASLRAHSVMTTGSACPTRMMLFTRLQARSPPTVDLKIW